MLNCVCGPGPLRSPLKTATKFLARFTVMLLLAFGMARAAESQPAQSAQSPGDTYPELRTNQHLIEELVREPVFDIENMKAVFRFIFSSLPAEVQVYPTENYYYFKFYHRGIEYAGNLRLAAIDRDKGFLHFAYFADASASSREGAMHYLKLSGKDGVRVEKTGPLEYRVRFDGKQVTFHLNDVSNIVPPKGLMRNEEIYLGPVFDESGLKFYLLFNSKLKIFHYILNESRGSPDRFIASDVSERILIGTRSGFAFYKDHHIDRKVLIGVHAANVEANNYFDGPFDQLPDNFLKGDSLKDAIEASDPAMAGHIDRFGYLASGQGRYLIGPYIQYKDTSELKDFDDCASAPDMPHDKYPNCFAMQGGGR